MIGPLLDRFCFWNLPSFFKSYELPAPHEVIREGGLEIWYVPGKPDGPTVLFCHGNAGNLRFPNARRDRLMAIHQTGANLWAFDYRGFGRSQGRPSESGVYEDALLVHGLARERHRAGNPFILYGRSLGGAVATYLATELEPPDRLVLESTFTSAVDVCAGWVGQDLAQTMSYRFNSSKRIEHLKCPLYMMHGRSDRVVRYALGRKLYERYKGPKEFVSVVGAGHNNLQKAARGLYEETLQRWLSPTLVEHL